MSLLQSHTIKQQLKPCQHLALMTTFSLLGQLLSVVCVVLTQLAEHGACASM